jgi:hypothetical protein
VNLISGERPCGELFYGELINFFSLWLQILIQNIFYVEVYTVEKKLGFLKKN